MYQLIIYKSNSPRKTNNNKKYKLQWEFAFVPITKLLL